MNVQYENFKRIEGDYYGNGIEVICNFNYVRYELSIFSTEDYINTEEKISIIDEQLIRVLSWIEKNKETVHKRAVDENYDWLFDELISDSDYYTEKGSITIDEIINFTKLAWVKVFCEIDKIKSFLLCYEETEEINAALLGGNTFGIEISISEL